MKPSSTSPAEAFTTDPTSVARVANVCNDEDRASPVSPAFFNRAAVGVTRAFRFCWAMPRLSAADFPNSRNDDAPVPSSTLMALMDSFRLDASVTASLKKAPTLMAANAAPIPIADALNDALMPALLTRAREESRLKSSPACRVALRKLLLIPFAADRVDDCTPLREVLMSRRSCVANPEKSGTILTSAVATGVVTTTPGWLATRAAGRAAPASCGSPTPRTGCTPRWTRPW